MSFRQYKSVWIVENVAFSGGYNLYETKAANNKFSGFLGWAGTLAGARKWITQYPLPGRKRPQTKAAPTNKVRVHAAPIVRKPKKGDTVSLEFRYMGLVSYEPYVIDRVRLNQVWIESHDHPFDAATGRYSRDEGDARRELKFDSGCRAAQADLEHRVG